MVDYDKHVRRGHPIMFSLIIVFAIIELAISGWLVARFNKHHNYPSISVRDKTRFLLFTSTWTILGCFFYMILFLRSASAVSAGPGSALTSVGSHGIFMFMTWVFWLSGAAAITNALGGGVSCGGSNHVTYCGQLNALEAFAWIDWCFTTFALAIIILRGVASTRRGDGLRGQLVAA
ncbi:hypothetical protein NM688_g8276 [Phlebia brevispora]|uniref:Uncharacterized protein n=1 Tax=Phlebia brevispora TaxID=194682 RepID=A0ACC1RV11_9APHY|nr:hypothetical protein NM688_g8276 [Phlebia brevispora]